MQETSPGDQDDALESGAEPGFARIFLVKGKAPRVTA